MHEHERNACFEQFFFRPEALAVIATDELDLVSGAI
jgi:hypothetical protein